MKQQAGKTTPTDSRSRRIRASRRGGQVLTRAQSPSSEERPARPRLLLDAPVPDGRTVLTTPDAHRRREAVYRHGRHLPPFIPVTNTIEALNRQIRKIIKTRGHFPNEDSARKLLYLAITNAQTTWRSAYNWSSALAAFRMHFGDRLPDTAI